MSDHRHDTTAGGQTPTRRWRRTWGPLAILATLVVAGIVVQGSRGATLFATAHPATTPAGATPKSGQNMCAPRLPWDTVRQQAALQLHLTVAQVRARILGGKPIQDVAAAQHISPQRLHSIELHALQVGNQRWIRLGCNTRQAGAEYMRTYSRLTVPQLNQEFTTLFI